MIPAHRLKRVKRAVRREVLEMRDALAPEDRAERSRRIADRLLALPEIAAARTAMAFSSFGSEVDTGPILEGLTARGIALALPRIEAGDLVPIAFRPGDPMTAAPFGALEPSGDRALAPGEIDLVVTPGVAFDRRGSRIGYGGGFYDRFFRRGRRDALRVAVAFALQVVSSVPGGRADEPVDAIVTEDELIRVERRVRPVLG